MDLGILFFSNILYISYNTQARESIEYREQVTHIDKTSALFTHTATFTGASLYLKFILGRVSRSVFSHFLHIICLYTNGGADLGYLAHGETLYIISSSTTRSMWRP